MAAFEPDGAAFSSIKNKVVVISGAATGIGAATAKLLASHGAHVVIGDVNHEAAENLLQETPSLTFTKTDITVYDQVYELFRNAYTLHGQVDHAVSCAGIFEQGNWFDPGLTIDNVKDNSGDTRVLDVNVQGTLNFARIALPFLRHGLKKGHDNRSLTLLSSVNAFRESPGLYLYQASKHAIQGILRSSRKTLFERDGIRVNAINPGVVDTPMTKHMIGPWKQAGLFWQSAESVAKFIVALQTSPDINGKSIYIEGGDGWEIEDSFYTTQPQWLGTEATKRMRTNAEAVNKGALIPK